MSIRKQIILTDEMNKWLLALSKERGMSQSEIMRRGLAEWLQQQKGVEVDPTLQWGGIRPSTES